MKLADDLVDVSLWGHVEASVCVILACIPRISIFFMRTYRKYTRRAAENLHSGPFSAERGDGHMPALFDASEHRSASHSGMSEVGRSSDSKSSAAKEVSVG